MTRLRSLDGSWRLLRTTTILQVGLGWWWLLLVLGFDLGPEAVFLRAQLGGELGPEVGRLEDAADLDLAGLVVRVRAALDPLDRLVHRLDLPDPEAGDQLLGLGKR